MNAKVLFFALAFCGSIYYVSAQSQETQTNNITTNSEVIEIPVKYANTGNEKYDNKVYTREIIKYLRENYGLPAYQDNGNKDLDIPEFNRAMAEWHSEYPEFDEIMPFKIFSEFWLYDETCYPKAPELTEKNADYYDILFDKWMNKHPEGPASADETKESVSRYEQQKTEFYEKYYKK